MAGVADQVMEHVLEVAADLAEPPGLRLAPQQGVTRGREAVGRHRQFAGQQFLEVGDGRLLQRLARPAVEVVVDAEGILRRPAAAHGQVVLADIPAHQRLAQRAGGFAVEGQQQATAGGAVQAMDQEDRPAQLLAQAVGQEIVLAARQLAVVDHQPGRLVDHGQPVVGVQHRQRPRGHQCRGVVIHGSAHLLGHAARPVSWMPRERRGGRSGRAGNGVRPSPARP